MCGSGREHSFVHHLTGRHKLVVLASSSRSNFRVEGFVTGYTGNNDIGRLCVPSICKGRHHGRRPSGRKGLNIRKVSSSVLVGLFSSGNIRCRGSRPHRLVAGCSLFTTNVSNAPRTNGGGGGLLGRLGLPRFLSAGSLLSYLGSVVSGSRFRALLGSLWVAVVLLLYSTPRNGIFLCPERYTSIYTRYMEWCSHGSPSRSTEQLVVNLSRFTLVSTGETHPFSLGPGVLVTNASISLPCVSGGTHGAVHLALSDI